MSGFSSSPFEEKGNHYSVAVDMNYFHPSEMSVKVIDNAVVVVEAKHKERADEHYGCISRHFLHRYRLPNNVDPASITSDLSDKGILTVTAKKEANYELSRKKEYRRSWRQSFPSAKSRSIMDTDSYDESDYIFDDYHHLNPEVFYSLTKTPGKGIPDSEFEYFRFGCDCTDSQCTEQNNCSCLKYGDNYNRTEGGVVLAVDKFKNLPVFECHSQCSCFDILKKLRRDNKLDSRTTPGLCPNRNVQFGPIGDLEIFNAGPKGLGLRTKKKIPSGSFICEYAGEVISLEEAKERQKINPGMNYIFILKEFTGNKVSGVTCVDPTHVGNIGRYINHSCQPNSAIVPVRVNYTVPWLCVFAVRDIDKDEEICYDYSGYNTLSGEQKLGRKFCYCNSVRCKKFLPFDDV